MDDFIGFIMVLVIFVLGPLIEQMRKKNAPPPPPRRPLPQPDSQSSTRPHPVRVKNPPVAYPEPEARRADAERESAATMLPADLWEELTGMKRPSPVPQPLPPDVEEEWLELEEAQSYEDLTVETRRNRVEEAVSLEQMPRREHPIVVSMEAQPDPRQRHLDFHRKIDQPIAEAPAARAQWLSTPEELRRAFIAQVILGPPKGLE